MKKQKLVARPHLVISFLFVGKKGKAICSP